MPRPYPKEFRCHAVELARLREKPVSQIAAEAQSALHRGLQAEIDEASVRADHGGARRAGALGRANRQLELQTQILKRAAVDQPVSSTVPRV